MMSAIVIDQGGAVFAGWDVDTSSAVTLVGIVAPTLSVISGDGGKSPLPEITFVISMDVVTRALEAMGFGEGPIVGDRAAWQQRGVTAVPLSECSISKVEMPPSRCAAESLAAPSALAQLLVASPTLSVLPVVGTPSAFDCVVLVRTRSSWGSGVIVDPKGVIITCAHVVRDCDTVSVSVPSASAGHRWLACDVQFVGVGTLDFAVLRICARDRAALPPDTCAATLPSSHTSSEVHRGAPVVVVGFPLESTAMVSSLPGTQGHSMPIVTSGHLSSVVWSKVRPGRRT